MRISVIALMLVIAFFNGVGRDADVKRDSILFNFDWQFSYDKKTWIPVDLPHDYQISQPWVAPGADEKADYNNEAANIRSLLSSRAFKPLGKGYYRKTFVPDKEWNGRRVLVDFEGMLLVGDAYLNGKHIGKTDYGYLGFESDITTLLEWDKENILEVVCDTQNPNSSRWYTGGGLFRNVHLIVMNKQFHFTRHPLYITTKVAGKSAMVYVQVEFSVCPPLLSQSPNRAEKIDSLKFSYTIKDNNGNIVASKKCRKKYYERQRTNEYKLDSISIDNVKLWDLEHPHLYTIEVFALGNNGQILDKVAETFGVRTIEYDADYGFKLNGRKVLLKGIANHHTLGALGAAAYDRAIEKRIQLLKEIGVNHIRTSHNPYSKGFLHLCDKYGILVVDELYDKWLKQFSGDRVEWAEQWQHDLPEFIKRDRNHPSVVMWSLGNELQQEWGMPYADWGVTVYRSMKPVLLRYDNTRPITVAMHPRFRDVDTDSIPAPLALETDIASYNYRYMYFYGDSKRYPWMKFYQSEANTQGLGKNFFEMNLDKVIGLAYWGAIDYLGESQGWPYKGWNFGFFDISLQPKATAYFVKSYFTDEPMVHLSVYEGKEQMDWNGVNLGNVNLSEQWDASKGAKQTLYAFSNADEVELRINGKSKARLKNERSNPSTRNKFIFNDIEYEKGKAQAIAYINGNQVATHILETTGAVKGIKTVTDNDQWKADGFDLQHIRIYAVDSDGHRVFGSDVMLDIQVEGDAYIVAATNGDQTCEHINTPNLADRKHIDYPLYDGSAMVILRSENKGGWVKNVILKVNGHSFYVTP